MGLDPILASKKITEKYLRYIETTFFIKDKDYMKQFKKELQEKSFFAKGPYLDFTDSFEKGKSINKLISEGILSQEFIKLYKKENGEDSFINVNLYKHQELSIRKSVNDKNLIVTTGTGSGKTEAFLIPIINHLMREKEAGTLNDGVRALIIYPMNALANDQMKRMRKLLDQYKNITFGSYTGETEKTDKRAISKYQTLNNNESPLENERISRRQIKEKPPHILITNYAMLEYLLLRPEDNVFFHGSKANAWKYIVLDEAHTYTGATGIEVSMLMRRLKNKLQNNKKIRFILTSATLGDKKDNKKICDFATRLCAGANFDNNSIVRALRCSFNRPKKAIKIPTSTYKAINKLIEQKASINKYLDLIEKENINLDVNSKKEVNELLYDLIRLDGLYYDIRRVLQKNPFTIKNVAKKLSINENDLVDFVSVASKAEKNNIRLLDARYHMFIRSLEGVYITLGSSKKLSIVPKNKSYINGKEYKCYKISVCQYCGQIYIEAKIDELNSVLVQKKENERNEKNNFYMLLNENNIDEYEQDDIYNLCGRCGKIEKMNAVHSQMCDCGVEEIVKVLEYNLDLKKKKTKNRTLHKCFACESIKTRGSILRGFYLGQEAAASVIGTTLYEQLPSEEIEVVENTYEEDDDDFFGMDFKEVAATRDEFKKKAEKQLLVFSDSRQAAAYFAGYFDFTYNNILRRRLLMEALNDIDQYNEQGVGIKATVHRLAALFEEYDVVESDLSVKEAWKTILYEISSNDRNSLENLGLICFEYQGYNAPKMGAYKGEDVLTIQRLLANTFRRYCMFDFPLSSQMLKEDKEYYSYNGLECSMTLKKEKDDKNPYLKSWLPKSKRNARVRYILKTTDYNQDDALKFLEKIWNQVFKSNKLDGGLVAKKPNEYIMDILKFKIRISSTHNIDWYVCDSCGRLTVNNIKDKCPAYRCEGKLKSYNFDKEEPNNHYREQYSKLDIYPMNVKEHTAQLSPETAKKYQEKFVNHKINVLSCSTTFEMGVDVGELETVFMKNMPPTPANYTQRAGRAGRRKDSVAYSLTFCKLSSHDLTYFKKPKRMIKGKISPPMFKVENKKIIKRHMNAVIISAFWKKNKDRYNNVGVFFDDNNYKKLLNFINDLIENPDNNLRRYIDKFIPSTLRHNIDNWIRELKSEDGVLNREYISYKSEINELTNLKNEKLKESKAGKNVGSEIRTIDYYISKINKENILSFLSKKTIIPKYGFPVDTVELSTSFDAIKSNYNKSSKLRLQRDLMIAISEYAPESEVIADGNMYKSKFIKRPTNNDKVWDLYDFGVCPNEKCGHLNIKRNTSKNNSNILGECEVCNEEVRKENTFIKPEYGFIISSKIKKATTKKPKRTYRGEIFYVGDKDELNENKIKEYNINKTKIKIKSTSNDELVVINNSTFYVCNKCGFAKVDNKYKNEKYIVDKKKHKNPKGKWCDNKKLFKRTLGHNFKTDVAHISIEGYLEKERSLSILYALLEGVSQYLGIERNDISGTIHYNKLNMKNWETSFILFDKVPGGAGHVRRIGEANKNQFIYMLEKTLEVVEQCNCGEDGNGDSACYSCLCNYFNQSHHDFIKRRYVIDFLRGIIKNH